MPLEEVKLAKLKLLSRFLFRFPVKFDRHLQIHERTCVSDRLLVVDRNPHFDHAAIGWRQRDSRLRLAEIVQHQY